MSETEQLAREVRSLNAQVRTLLSIVGPLATRQMSRKEQERVTGKSRSTLLRQEKAARARMQVERLGGGVRA